MKGTTDAGNRYPALSGLGFKPLDVDPVDHVWLPRMMRILSAAASGLIGALVGLTGVAPAGALSACAELGGNVQSGNVCHARVATRTYVIDMHFGTDYPDNQAVIDYLTPYRDRVINAAQAPGAKNLPYQMLVGSQTFRSGSPSRGTQSLVLTNFQYVEGAPLGTTYKSFTFDFDLNRPVTFENLFAPDTNPIDSIYREVATSLARQQKHRHFQLSPGVGRDPALYKNFAITDETVIFLFDEGELLPQEVGFFFVPVSRASLPPLQL